MGMMARFREFAMRGNVIDLAVGMVIGAAFSKIVTALVDKVIMPPLGLLIGGVDFANSAWTLKGKRRWMPPATRGARRWCWHQVSSMRSSCSS